MADESEKRFEAIMNKLFHSPTKSEANNTRHGVQTLSGRKRLHSSPLREKFAGNVVGDSASSLSGSATSAQAPLCRPWDRNDLFRRLSTFKSMTWFAKPQVVSPLECAMRGWVNVDMDTVACESCEARLLFSTPSTWTQQQVEKAAMVFSLKLESGHKLLCPWINNTCAEELAQFPIQSRSGLIEDYKKRFLALSQLIALSVISPAAVGNMRSPQLEQFLRESSTSGYHELLETSRRELPGHSSESCSSILYYQAQKLISLFGWEPRMLPYRVDFNDRRNQSVKDSGVMVTTGQKLKVIIDSLSASEGSKASSEPQLDPTSVVLDCKLCGASVGLWAFNTIPRPLEYLRFVGLTEVTGKNTTTHDEVSLLEGSSGNQTPAGNRDSITGITTTSTSLGFTIAGGPPPGMLNYGATISLPIVGQNLRARLPIETETEDHIAIQGMSQVEDEQMSRESESINAEDTFATSSPDRSVTEGSILNVVEVSCLTPENNSQSRKGGGSEPNREGMVEVEKGGGSEPNREGMAEVENHEQGSISPGEDQNRPSFYKSMEFDPIKQHRHFCPWIMSTGKHAPGWVQTLSALEGHEELINVPSSTLVEVDDPVASVKYLFESPNKKRTNSLGGS